MFNFEKLSILRLNYDFFSQFVLSILNGNAYRILPAKIATLHQPVMILLGHHTQLMHLAIELTVKCIWALSPRLSSCTLEIACLDQGRLNFEKANCFCLQFFLWYTLIFNLKLLFKYINEIALSALNSATETCLNEFQDLICSTSNILYFHISQYFPLSGK